MEPSTECKLAIEGGEKAFSEMTGVTQPKIGIAEFLSIAERFGFSDDAMQRLKGAVTEDDLGDGPHLGRYYGTATPSMGERFEELACDTFKVKHAYAMCNGTMALEAALLAIGVKKGDEVIVPATGFIATAMAAARQGATPVFCDVDSSLQLDASKLEALITPRTVAIMPTHHMGLVCDMGTVMEIARRHNLRVIEDCAQSTGATYRGQSIGTFGDIGCFSISSYKIIGAGEGGMAITNDDKLFDRLRQAAEGGGLWRPNRFAAPRYEGELFIGSNARASELESAANVIQIQKLAGIVSRHRHVWKRIRTQLPQVNEIEWQKSNDPDGDIGYLMRFFPRDDAFGTKVAKALQAEGIEADYRGSDAAPDWHLYRDHYPLQDAHPEQYAKCKCPVAEDLHNRCISIRLNQWWSDEDCDHIAKGINKVLDTYCIRA